MRKSRRDVPILSDRATKLLRDETGLRSDRVRGKRQPVIERSAPLLNHRGRRFRRGEKVAVRPVAPPLRRLRMWMGRPVRCGLLGPRSLALVAEGRESGRPNEGRCVPWDCQPDCLQNGQGWLVLGSGWGGSPSWQSHGSSCLGISSICQALGQLEEDGTTSSRNFLKNPPLSRRGLRSPRESTHPDGDPLGPSLEK